MDYYGSYNAVGIAMLAFPVLGAIGIPIIFGAGFIDEMISTSRDRVGAESVQHAEGAQVIEDSIAAKVSKTMALTGMRCEYILVAPPTNPGELAAFDGLLSIDVQELQLVRGASDPQQARVSISASVELWSLRSNRAIWNRRKELVSNESYDVERLQTGQLAFSEVVDPTLNRLVRFLLRDIQYVS